MCKVKACIFARRNKIYKYLIESKATLCYEQSIAKEAMLCLQVILFIDKLIYICSFPLRAFLYDLALLGDIPFARPFFLLAFACERKREDRMKTI